MRAFLHVSKNPTSDHLQLNLHHLVSTCTTSERPMYIIYCAQNCRSLVRLHSLLTLKNWMVCINPLPTVRVLRNCTRVTIRFPRARVSMGVFGLVAISRNRKRVYTDKLVQDERLFDELNSGDVATSDRLHERGGRATASRAIGKYVEFLL